MSMFLSVLIRMLGQPCSVNIEQGRPIEILRIFWSLRLGTGGMAEDHQLSVVTFEIRVLEPQQPPGIIGTSLGNTRRKASS